MLSPAEQSIRAWESDNDIDLSEEAFLLLVKQAKSDCTNCTATYHSASEFPQPSFDQPAYARTAPSGKEGEYAGRPVSAPQKASPEPVLPPSGELRRALYDYYLDQLRDINRKKGKRPVVEADDVQAYTYTSFLKDLGFASSSLGQLGRLIVQSRPGPAYITINDQRKGYTNKRFVVSAGSYRIKIIEPSFRLSCDTTIAIGELETKVVVCEPSS